jgi:phosphoethanolamine N-methyltransferase
MHEKEEGGLYTGELIVMLEAVWGEGWLSPGGPEEVVRLIAGIPFHDKEILDIGCGTGGIDFYLVRSCGARHVTGIDVETTVVETARRRAQEHGLADRVAFQKVAPGPLPFPDARFDIVFSKDAIVHIPDKHALLADIHRVVRPGGWFVASDWLISHEGEPSPAMAAYIAAEGLDFGMASPARYRDALAKAGFADVALVNRNEWYRQIARYELEALRGRLYEPAAAKLGREFVDHNIEIWEKMIVVLDTGEHCPHHLRGRKSE